MDEKDIEDDFEREIRIIFVTGWLQAKLHLCPRPTYEFQIFETSILSC